MPRAAFFISVLMALSLAGSASAQRQTSPFANPENLKVLPKDISEGRLRAIMRGVSLGLGVRCTYCHKGTEETPFREIDFSADAKPEKEIARDMMRMVGRINDSVKETLEKHEHERDEADHHDPVRVRCVTCHRGQPHPRLIQDVLDEKLAEEGVEAAVAEYMALRKEYYGSHTFDFSAGALSDYAVGLGDRGKGDAAIRLHKLAAELYPEDARVFASMGFTYRRLGKLKEAEAAFQRALEINPDMRFAQMQLDQVRKEMAGSGK